MQLLGEDVVQCATGSNFESLLLTRLAHNRLVLSRSHTQKSRISRRTLPKQSLLRRRGLENTSPLTFGRSG